MNRYKVLWIDDNFDDQDAFLDKAFQNGLDIQIKAGAQKFGMVARP